MIERLERWKDRVCVRREVREMERECVSHEREVRKMERKNMILRKRDMLEIFKVRV